MGIAGRPGICMPGYEEVADHRTSGARCITAYIETNLTRAGCLLWFGGVALLLAAWWLFEFVLDWRVNTFRFIVGGGLALIGGGTLLLNRLGIDTTK